LKSKERIFNSEKKNPTMGKIQQTGV